MNMLVFLLDIVFKMFVENKQVLDDFVFFLLFASSLAYSATLMEHSDSKGSKFVGYSYQIQT